LYTGRDLYAATATGHGHLRSQDDSEMGEIELSELNAVFYFLTQPEAEIPFVSLEELSFCAEKILFLCEAKK